MVIDLLIFVFIIIAIIWYIIKQLFLVLFTPTAIVSGTTKDVDGVPVAGVAVNLVSSDGTGLVYTAVSGEDGKFAFQPAKPGNYTIAAFKDNGDGSHYSGQVDIVLGTEDMAVDVTLEKIIASNESDFS